MGVIPERWEDPWTASIYDCQTRHANWLKGDIEFWQALAREFGGPILELGCGTGRVALELARAGWHVTALDLSPHMLAVFRDKVKRERAEVAGRIRLVHGDMREFSLGGRFPLIISPYHTFQFLLQRSEQRSCLHCVVNHLAPGGKLAMTVSNPRLSQLLAPHGVEDELQQYLGPDGSMVRQQGHRTYSLADQRLTHQIRYECTGPDGRLTVHEHRADMRYFFRFELEWMLEACGLDIEALYGDSSRGPLSDASWEIFLVARSRAPLP